MDYFSSTPVDSSIRPNWRKSSCKCPAPLPHLPLPSQCAPYAPLLCGTSTNLILAAAARVSPARRRPVGFGMPPTPTNWSNAGLPVMSVRSSWTCYVRKQADVHARLVGFIFFERHFDADLFKFAACNSRGVPAPSRIFDDPFTTLVLDGRVYQLQRHNCTSAQIEFTLRNAHRRWIVGEFLLQY